MDQSAKPPVATGPYRVTSYQPNREIVLERNPNFQQWSPDIPNGHVDRIDIKLTSPRARRWPTSPRGRCRLHPVAHPALARRAARPTRARCSCTASVEAATYYYFMNVNVAPFNDVRVRRAVNYAIDRRTDRGPLRHARPSRPSRCSRPPSRATASVDPYPGPDLARARRLVELAGAVGSEVTVWGYNTEPSPSVTKYLAGVLRSLGFQVHERFLDKAVFLDTVDDRRTRAQIGYARWQQDFPDGVDYFDLLLNGRNITAQGNLNYSYMDDPRLNRMIDHAREIADPAARAAAWAGVERAALSLAPWAPFANTVRTDVTSPRVNGYVYQQTFGFLWMKASVR